MATSRVVRCKMPAGRPTDYDPSYPESILEYFNIEAGHDIAYETKEGEQKTMRVAVDLPTFAGFACKIGTHRATMLDWCKRFPEFEEAYKCCKEHQERILVQNGLKGGYHGGFAIFTAKNVLEWRDKSEHTGADGKDLIPVPDLNDPEVLKDVARRLAFVLSGVKKEP